MECRRSAQGKAWPGDEACRGISAGVEGVVATAFIHAGDDTDELNVNSMVQMLTLDTGDGPVAGLRCQRRRQG